MKNGNWVGYTFLKRAGKRNGSEGIGNHCEMKQALWRIDNLLCFGILYKTWKLREHL